MAESYTPIPDEWLEEMGELGEAEYGRLIRWCQRYNITGAAEALTGNERFFAKRCQNSIDRIKAAAERTKTARSEAGKAGAEKRWGDGTIASDSNTMASDSKAIANDSNTMAKIATKTKTKTKAKTKTIDPFSAYAEKDPALGAALAGFSEMRVKIKKPMTDRAKKILLTRLEELSGGDYVTMTAILDQSTAHSWSDIYELKTKPPAKQTGFEIGEAEARAIRELHESRRRGGGII